MQFNRDELGNFNVTTTPQMESCTEHQRREGGGIRPGFSPRGAGSPVTPPNDIRKLKKMEKIGKEYSQDSAKFGDDRDKDFGSTLSTFQRNIKLYRVDEDQWVSVFPLMLKKCASGFYEDQVEKKSLVDTLLFHSLVHLFKHEYSTKERENELWLE